MIFNFCRMASPLNNIYSLTKLSLHTRYRKNVSLFYFSEDKKNNQKENDKGVEGVEGKILGEKKEEEDATQSSKFGNSMLLASALALALAYAYMQIQVIRANKKKKTDTSLIKQTGAGKAQIGGNWQLRDTNGKMFGSKDLEGSYYLIYFGFTHCPDICPNSLTKLSKAVARVKKASNAKFYNLKTIFISVDPDRDSPQKLKKFINLFDPEMIGVTGTHNLDPALRQCMKQFKIYASKLQFQDENDLQKGRKSYTIDHTILTYLMSDTNEYLTHLGANMGQHDLASLIIQKIQEDKREKMKILKI